MINFINKYVRKRHEGELYELKSKNSLLNKLEILLERPVIDSFPPWLEVEFTNACNLRCFMCYQSNHDITYAQMSDETLGQVINILPFVKTILIAGLGEQLLYQKLGLFLKNAKHCLCDVQMFTNGHLIHKNLDIFKYISKLTISFDGATKEDFETQRYGANFNKVISNIKLLRKTYPGLKITLGCVVSKLNVHHLEQVVNIAANLGVYGVTFPHVQHAPKIELTKSDYRIIKNQINKAKCVANKNSIALSFNDIEYIKNINSQKKEIGHAELLADINTESRHRQEITPKDAIGLQNITGAPMSFSGEAKINIYKGIKKAIQSLDSKIEKAEEEIRKKRIRSISEPYCLAPWVYGFIKMNGNFRLCPYFDFEAGNINMFREKGLNENSMVDIRKSLLSKTDMLTVCETCPDSYHREFSFEEFKNVAGMHKITVKENQ